jgi:hypothetical protein
MASVETATLSLRLFTFVSPFFEVHRFAPITDFRNYIGEGDSIEAILEAVLRFF